MRTDRRSGPPLDVLTGVAYLWEYLPTGRGRWCTYCWEGGCLPTGGGGLLTGGVCLCGGVCLLGDVPVTGCALFPGGVCLLGGV